MVPSSAGNAVQFPTATTSGVSHNPENIQSELDGQLAVWPVSGISFQVETFHMTHTLGSGWAGVMNGVRIPFQMLQIFWLIYTLKVIRPIL